MQGFQKVVGHQEIITHLQNAISMNKVSHAYLFGGESGSGKKMMASLFAMTLQCEKHGVEPCMECPSCKKAQSQNHPDIIYVKHEKPNTISIDEIREQLINDVMIKPYSSPYKIYIIDEAQKLTLQAQNALLKTIEEPPAYAVILLLANNADRLLPTILSRCVRLNLKAVRDQDIREYLMDKMKIPDYQADVSLKFAQGNVGKAVQLASSETFAAMKDEALSLLHETDRMELYELMDAVKKISDYKNDIDSFLDIVTIWLRDVLMFKATQDANSLIFREDLSAITARARKSSVRFQTARQDRLPCRLCIRLRHL